MSLIVVCGIPGSGKTKRSKEVAAYLSEKYSKNVFIINEETLGIDKNTSYASSHISIKILISKKLQEEE
jgi:tRNA uridine 5-carbamoylmethylation protein Kti12